MKGNFYSTGVGACLILFSVSCDPVGNTDSTQAETYERDSLVLNQVQDSLSEGVHLQDSFPAPEFTGPDSASLLEEQLIAQGLVDVQRIAPAIQVNLKYASTDNFLGEDVYHGLNRCFLQPEVAEMLAEAQQMLSQLHPDLSLLIFDGVRPQSVQFRMWDLVKGTDQASYVAEPHKGSLHNFGAAVDLGLTHQDTGMLDMGTPYDYFGDLAQPRYEGDFLQTGELTLTQVENRRLLRTVMNRAGFTGILNEWWHFNAFPKAEIRERYKIVK